MKSVLYLNYEFPPLGGGAAPVSYAIAKGYVDSGYKVDVVTMAFGDLPKYEKKDGINIYRVNSLRRKKAVSGFWEHLLYLGSAWIQLQKLLRKNTYSFCHCHFLVPTGILALFVKKIYRINYIITSHGSDVPGYNIDRFKFLHLFTGQINRSIIRNSIATTTPSQFLKDLIIERILNRRPANNLMVIPNGSRSLVRPNIAKENIVLSVGRMHPMKGFQYLIEAFNALRPN
jgi:glycosyltransferase involved in cell wall biosynthesis